MRLRPLGGYTGAIKFGHSFHQNQGPQYMFAGFDSRNLKANAIQIHCRIGGSGPPLLLLHGHPQTHIIWHKIAEDLAKRFTVVAADLRGYGDSDRPPRSPDAENYTKRVMATDQAELMRGLGFSRFSVVAHDRGARVAHRMAMDFPDVVQKMMLLDVAPTLAMYEQTNETFARVYWHWFFLIRPAPFPESIIEADPESYLEAIMAGRSNGLKPFSEEAMEEYLRCVSLPGSSTAICEDYRASAGVDLEHDRQDRQNQKKVTCPLRVLWGQEGAVGQCFNPLAEWRKVASEVTGAGLACGHYVPEEVPDLLLSEIVEFLR